MVGESILSSFFYCLFWSLHSTVEIKMHNKFKQCVKCDKTESATGFSGILDYAIYCTDENDFALKVSKSTIHHSSPKSKVYCCGVDSMHCVSSSVFLCKLHVIHTRQRGKSIVIVLLVRSKIICMSENMDDVSASKPSSANIWCRKRL